MSILTPFFHLLKLVKGDAYDIQQFNQNMDTIDTEMHRPPLTVNNIQPDPTSRNIQITTVPLADNLTSDQMQTNTGTYIVRSAGGDASISDGSAVLSDILGNMVKTGYVPESIVPAVVTGDLEISVDRDTFVEAVTSSQILTFSYTTAWNADPATYGITVSGEPASGDQFTVTYVKEDRGTITAATPAMFISTGWNLFNYSTGYARVTDYSQDYGFMIAGTYSTIKFAETISGEKVTITPINGFFTLPAGATDGYIFITGGNTTDTMLWMTWSDWEEEPNEGVFEPYSQTSIDLTGVMVSFPYGLMKVGTYADEINLNTQKAYSRIERLAYTDENLEDVIALGLPYDTDENYIFAVRRNPVVYDIEVSGNYTVSDHGEEYFTGTSVPVEATSFYGNDLKTKLRRNVLTISQQTLTDQQKEQVLQNIGASPAIIAEQVAALLSNAFGKGQAALRGAWSCGGFVSGGGKDLYICFPLVTYGVTNITSCTLTNITVRGVNGYLLHDDTLSSGGVSITALRFIPGSGIRIQLSKNSGTFDVINNTPVTANIDGTITLV